MRSLTRDHLVQPAVIFAILQMGAILVGIIGMGMGMKANDSFADGSIHWPWQLVAVRNFGILLLAIPAAWSVTALHLENNEASRWTPRWSVVTGCVIFACLAYLMFDISCRAWTPPMRPIQTLSS